MRGPCRPNEETHVLYRLITNSGTFRGLEPVPFKDFSSFGNQEEDLEDLIARNVLDVLFEDASLMPIFQERSWQAEADIYALNEKGELIIFELKRGTAGDDAVVQILRYAQHAGQWTYGKLQEMYRTYSGKTSGLAEAHQEAFALEVALDPKEVNRRQHLIVIGSAADDGLISAVDYWRGQGVSIDFLPYRIYELSGKLYFEFFARPYDRHVNPGDVKGVLFDTNKSYDEDSIWYMMNHACVAAFGDAQRFVDYVKPGDFVFFYHGGSGLVAAARVRPGPVRTSGTQTSYRNVVFITPIPEHGGHFRAMPIRTVSEVTGKTFFMARTIKVPYLSTTDSEHLARELGHYLNEDA